MTQPRHNQLLSKIYRIYGFVLVCSDFCSDLVRIREFMNSSQLSNIRELCFDDITSSVPLLTASSLYALTASCRLDVPLMTFCIAATKLFASHIA
jgi:hypothetical protein